jgi:hypothetical protein
MSNWLVSSRRAGAFAPIFGHAVRRADLILPDRFTALLSPLHSAAFSASQRAGTQLTRTLMQAFGSLEARVSQYNSHRPTKRQPV